MCGIFCCISQNSGKNLQRSNEWCVCKELISSRGPDKLSERLEVLTEKWTGHFAGGVLWTQGPKLIPQPIADADSNVLLWNGDIFSGKLANDNACDTMTILNSFQSCPNVLSVLRDAQGPYSFVYFQRSTNLLYFGRDVIGRHSLLLKLDSRSETLILTSAAKKQIAEIAEVPSIGIFVMDLSNSRLNLACHPWREPDLRFTDVIELLERKLELNIDIKETILTDSVESLHFSPDAKDVEYLEDITFADFNEALRVLLDNKKVKQRVERLSELLHESVKVRVRKKPNFCGNCMKLVLEGEEVACDHTKVGILFSGGLDSAILTLIAHKYVPERESIDLINVAFEKRIKDTEGVCSTKYDVPDRKTGKETLMELRHICPTRKWNFIEVNISQAELEEYRSSRIRDLLHPLRTVLHESLGCAVWFASRAEGTNTTTNSTYSSACRILLLGMGADELFGGYLRHRTILRHKGWEVLSEELSNELARISERNLGRDDRIVSDHGKQPRLPYLDENFVEYVRQLKPWERCYPTEKMPPGLGDKLLLRLLAFELGFRNTANFPKRAFQFGSRIANGKENASDISERL